jgi:hypothetical protein
MATGIREIASSLRMGVAIGVHGTYRVFDRRRRCPAHLAATLAADL